jgi:hypothetical protein
MNIINDLVAIIQLYRDCFNQIQEYLKNRKYSKIGTLLEGLQEFNNDVFELPEELLLVKGTFFEKLSWAIKNWRLFFDGINVQERISRFRVEVL